MPVQYTERITQLSEGPLHGRPDSAGACQCSLPAAASAAARCPSPLRLTQGPAPGPAGGRRDPASGSDLTQRQCHGSTQRGSGCQCHWQWLRVGPGPTLTRRLTWPTKAHPLHPLLSLLQSLICHDAVSEACEQVPGTSCSSSCALAVEEVVSRYPLNNLNIVIGPLCTS